MAGPARTLPLPSTLPATPCFPGLVDGHAHLPFLHKANIADSGFWSRRIDDQHRLVYAVEGDNLAIIACRYHYD